MPQVNQIKQFEQLTGSAITTAAPAALQSGQGLPTGNMLLTDLILGSNLNLTIGTGTTPRTNGELAVIDSIFVDTDKHGPIIESLDGLGLGRVLQNIYGSFPETTAIAASTANYYSGFRIPLAIPENAHALRAYDTALDLFNARMTARVQYTDLGKAFATVGTASAIPTVNWSGRVVYSPDEENELPILCPVFKLKKVAITATTAGLQIPMDFGGLVYAGIGISQRDTSTNVEVSDIIVPSAKIRLDVNGRDVIAPTENRDLRAFAKIANEIETNPASWTWLDFYSQSGRIAEAVDTIGLHGNMNLYTDVVYTANRAVWIYTWGFKPIAPNALRNIQLAK